MPKATHAHAHTHAHALRKKQPKNFSYFVAKQQVTTNR